MNELSCAAAREKIIEADLSELRPERGTALARHLASCTDCAERARIIAEGYAMLGAGLDEMSAAYHARAERQPDAAKTDLMQPIVTTATRSSSRRLRAAGRLAWPLPLAAAAVLMLLLMRGADEPPAPSPLLLSLMFPVRPDVTAPAGKDVVVLERNELTIVWFPEETP